MAAEIYPEVKYDGKLWLVVGESWVQKTPEIIERFLCLGCTCRIIPVYETDTILAGGEDDCPVHGLKKVVDTDEKSC